MTKRQRKGTILIIEDSPDICAFASRVMAIEGYRVLQAERGEEGLGLLRDDRIDLVLLDLKLPGIDGWAVVKEMKSDPECASIPVIIFSASIPSLARENAASMGIVDYLVKPLSADTLVEAVDRILQPNPEAKLDLVPAHA
jgi:DNA-binding response OmpR family regulator